MAIDHKDVIVTCNYLMIKSTSDAKISGTFTVSTELGALEFTFFPKTKVFNYRSLRKEGAAWKRNVKYRDAFLAVFNLEGWLKIYEETEPHPVVNGLRIKKKDEFKF